MSSDFFLSYQAIEDSEIPSGPATTPAAHQSNNRTQEYPRHEHTANQRAMYRNI